MFRRDVVAEEREVLLTGKVRPAGFSNNPVYGSRVVLCRVESFKTSGTNHVDVNGKYVSSCCCHVRDYSVLF
jgi:hypothetical protein